ncbi:hypothetical protein P0L94_16530 [Microbacter sp. GSS18]|nr:hypothetical protein P0L94_16530 [Microbacter sp. GSS18]
MIELLGWVGSGLIVLSLVQRDLKRLRIINIVACIVLIVFNAVLGIGSMVALNLILVAVNSWYLVRPAWGRGEDSGSLREEVVDVG